MTYWFAINLLGGALSETLLVFLPGFKFTRGRLIMIAALAVPGGILFCVS